MTAKSTVLPLLLATVTPLTPTALAAPSGASVRPPRSATIYVVRQRAGSPRRAISFTVALAEDSRPSNLELRDEHTSYRIAVSHHQRRGATAVVRLNLKCSERRAICKSGRPAGRCPPGAARRRARSTTEVALNSRVTLGRRTVLGRVRPASGGELRVSVLLR